MKMKRRQTISVIIPTKNRPESLLRVFRALHTQAPRVDEVVVVDTSDTVFQRKTRTIANSFPSMIIRYWKLSHASASEARNFGIRHSTGDILAFLDDDSVPERGWVQAINQAVRVGPFWFRGQCVDASENNTLVHQVYTFYRELITHDLNRRWQTYGRYKGYQIAGLIQAGNFFVHRETLRRIRPVFDEHLFPFIAEGTDLSLRIGKSGSKILYAPKAKIRHYFLRLSYVNFVIYEAFWYGRAYQIFNKRNISSLSSYSHFEQSVLKLMKQKKIFHMSRLIGEGWSLFRSKYTKNAVYNCLFLLVFVNYLLMYWLGMVYGTFEYAWSQNIYRKKK